MPERDRPSLTGLAIKKPLLERGKPVVPINDAETALLGAEAAGAVAASVAPAVQVTVPAIVQPEVLEEVHSDDHDQVQSEVQSPVLQSTLLKARKKEIKIAWTFKIPLDLHKELSAVAAYNELAMSDIVIEAIRFHLPNFPHPRK